MYGNEVRYGYGEPVGPKRTFTTADVTAVRATYRDALYIASLSDGTTEVWVKLKEQAPAEVAWLKAQLHPRAPRA